MSVQDSPFKKKFENPPGITDGEMIEWGNDLEAMTRTKGWIWVESFMFRNMNVVGLILADKDKQDPDQKGIAKGYINLMQAIELTIQKKNELITKEKEKYETENVSKDEGKQGV